MYLAGGNIKLWLFSFLWLGWRSPDSEEQSLRGKNIVKEACDHKINDRASQLNKYPNFLQLQIMFCQANLNPLASPAYQNPSTLYARMVTAPWINTHTQNPKR
ncbi:hypothetical protein CROQUDRAFT_655819 [Cronartium quercuum f. sp. fusiforme G11]|uniref:Secreted protein n=1 Tax=Cronartium quercuum f. sp. fusiforme G11 TaxID=708437 RepID=A0A9P6NPF4_9BASI|nr:hypothetical protein CROQUDRAFT_655819 [Cronartium quercuum f. sp. fusiforme G11]